LSPGDVRSKLARLLAGRLGETAAASDVQARLRARGAAARAELPADLVLECAGSVLARCTVIDADSSHGTWRLAEALGADSRASALLTRDPALAGVDLEKALFLDTETSGLSGGAGTWVFLVGLGSFEASESGSSKFVVWQGFLAEPAAERALLAVVAEKIASAAAVVSFFGKSFDRHRLEDKMRLHGIAPPFAGRPHLDLYHPLRRLYRPRIGDGFDDARLRTLERELCGVVRHDDLPGALAPAAWFDFLHGRPHELEGVFRHNRDDVLSLVTLAAHLARTLVETRAGGGALEGPAAPRARALARAWLEARDPRESLAWFERARERSGGALPEPWERLSQRARRRVERASAP
jgi:hypothetical protein